MGNEVLLRSGELRAAIEVLYTHYDSSGDAVTSLKATAPCSASVRYKSLIQSVPTVAETAVVCGTPTTLLRSTLGASCVCAVLAAAKTADAPRKR